jgi:hypothetical protein
MRSPLDWLTFFSTVMKAIAWPLLIGIIVIVLRQHIETFLNTLGTRLKTAKGGGLEFTFREAINEVEEKLPPAEMEAITKAQDKHIDQVSDLARLPPPYIVSQAWLRLEEALRKAGDKYARGTTVPELTPSAGSRLPTRH